MRKELNGNNHVEVPIEFADKVVIDLNKDAYIIGDFDPSNSNGFNLMVNAVDGSDIMSMISHLMLNLENKTGVSMEETCKAILATQGSLQQTDIT